VNRGTSPPAPEGIRAPLRRIDPRARIGLVVVFVAFVVLTPPHPAARFLVYGAMVRGFGALAGIPWRAFLRRLGVILPFVGLVAASAALGCLFGWEYRPLPELMLVFLVRPLVAVAAVAALVSGMEPYELAAGLSGLGLPRSLVALLLFLVRYFPLLRLRMSRLRTAVEARSFGWRGIRGRRRLLLSLGNLVGTMFVRSLDHGERVYLAMCARGFTGAFVLPRYRRPTFPDVAFLAAGLGALLLNFLFVR